MKTNNRVVKRSIIWIVLIFFIIIGIANFRSDNSKKEILLKTLTLVNNSIGKKSDNSEIILPLVYSKQYETIKIGSIGYIDLEYIENVKKDLKLIPAELLKSYINNEWEIYVTTENLSQKYFEGKYTRVLAVTSFKLKRIEIEEGEMPIEKPIVHEFGHYLDYQLNFISLGEEFKQIYLEEVEEFKSNIDNSYSVNNEKEFFAEIFRYSIINQSKCTPKALQFVKNQIDTFINGEYKSAIFKDVE